MITTFSNSPHSPHSPQQYPPIQRENNYVEDDDTDINISGEKRKIYEIQEGEETNEYESAVKKFKMNNYDEIDNNQKEQLIIDKPENVLNDVTVHLDNQISFDKYDENHHSNIHIDVRCECCYDDLCQSRDDRKAFKMECGHRYCRFCFDAFRKLFGKKYGCQNDNCSMLNDTHGLCFHCIVKDTMQCTSCLSSFCLDCEKTQNQLNYCEQCNKYFCEQSSSHPNGCVCECNTKDKMYWYHNKCKRVEDDDRKMRLWYERQECKRLATVIHRREVPTDVHNEDKRIIELAFIKQYSDMFPSKNYAIKITYEYVMVRKINRKIEFEAKFRTLILLDEAYSF